VAAVAGLVGLRPAWRSVCVAGLVGLPVGALEKGCLLCVLFTQGYLNGNGPPVRCVPVCLPRRQNNVRSLPQDHGEAKYSPWGTFVQDSWKKRSAFIGPWRGGNFVKSVIKYVFDVYRS